MSVCSGAVCAFWDGAGAPKGASISQYRLEHSGAGGRAIAIADLQEATAAAELWPERVLYDAIACWIELLLVDCSVALREL